MIGKTCYGFPVEAEEKRVRDESYVFSLRAQWMLVLLTRYRRAGRTGGVQDGMGMGGVFCFNF